MHLAAQNGHKNCLTFLVKLGANIFALDNDYNTALAVAGNRGQTQCVEYLDSVFSQQKDKKKVSLLYFKLLVLILYFFFLS